MLWTVAADFAQCFYELLGRRLSEGRDALWDDYVRFAGEVASTRPDALSARTAR